MELFEQIRRAQRLDPELSIRQLAVRFGTHRRTVRDALRSAVPPPRKQVVRPSPAMDRWKATVDGWLEAVREAPPKQRHTARRVWQRLVEGWWEMREFSDRPSVKRVATLAKVTES